MMPAQSPTASLDTAAQKTTVSPGHASHYFKRSSVTTNRDHHFIVFHSRDRLFVYEPRTHVSKERPNDFRLNIYRPVDRPDLPNEYKFFHKIWEFIGSAPFLWTVLKRTEEYLPQFLFRVISDTSKGSNTADGFRSEAACAGAPAEIASFTEEDLRKQFIGHTRNRRLTARGQGFGSHFISLTSSFLWALYRARKEDLKGRQNVCLCVIDTYRLREPAIIFKARELTRAFQETHPFQIAKAEAEFVVWDALIGDTSIVPIETLKPIWKTLVPELSKMSKDTGDPLDPPRPIPVKPFEYRQRQRSTQEDRAWLYDASQVHGFSTIRKDTYAGRVVHGRLTTQKICAEESIGLTHEEIKGAHQVAGAFAQHLRFPIMVAILSLRSKCHTQTDIIAALDTFFEGKAPTYDSSYYGNDFETRFCLTDKDTPFIKELKTFQELLKACCEHFGLRYYAGAKRPNRKLQADVEAAQFLLDPDTDVYVDELFTAAANRRAKAKRLSTSTELELEPLNKRLRVEMTTSSADIDEQTNVLD